MEGGEDGGHLLCLSPEGGRIASASSNAFAKHAVHEFLALAQLYGELAPFQADATAAAAAAAAAPAAAAAAPAAAGGTAASAANGRVPADAFDADAVAAALLRGPVRVRLRQAGSARRIARRLVSLDLLEVWAEGSSAAELPGCGLLRQRLAALEVVVEEEVEEGEGEEGEEVEEEGV